MKHSPRWGTTGMDTKWETRTRGNENEGGHTGLGPDRSYPELTGVVSERVLTSGHIVVTLSISLQCTYSVPAQVTRSCPQCGLRSSTDSNPRGPRPTHSN